MAVQNTQQDNRIHSTVYHKRDRRINDIIRRCKKSEVINLYNIDALMLFRAETAHVQFDMLSNHRPYLLFHGAVEGVYLPAKTGLLFPNACDQLDFRNDFRVDSAITYALSDAELSVLATNGLFNPDYSCQGRVIGSLLEIPCKVDYYAIANTPITFIEIQDRLSLHTSTSKTGYKSLVAAFLPYSMQKHNMEEFPNLVQAEEYNRDASEIRKRKLYDSKAIGFETDPHGRTMKDGASFVEVAQDRIKQRLQQQMQKSNVLELSAEDTSKQITDAVTTIKQQIDKTKHQTLFDLEHNANKVEAATLDARLDDLANRMIYAGAQEIPVTVKGIKEQSLVEKKPVGQNDTNMTDPLTDTATSADTVAAANRAQNAAEKIGKLDNNIHQNMFDAEETAQDIVKTTLSRKEKLAQRRQKNIQIQQRALEAAEDEVKQGMTKREVNVSLPNGPKSESKKDTTTAKAKMDRQLESDILSSEIDMDELIKTLGV